MIIDIFGHEYGYTPKEVLGLPLLGALFLIRRITARYPQKGGRPVDVASTDWLKDIAEGG